MNRLRYYLRMLYWQYCEFRMRQFAHLFANRPADAYSPKWHKLWNLYWRIKKYKPESVTEFGSGCSTIIMAQALHENEKGHLYAYDESEQWQKATVQSLPDYLKNTATVTHSPVRETEFDGIKGFEYMSVRERERVDGADFIYLDGPELRPDRKVAFDVLFFKKMPKYIVVDSRKSNCDFLKKYLKGYSFSYNFLNNQSLFTKQ